MVSTNLRVPDDVHRLARLCMAERHLSLNAWIVEAMRSAIMRQAKAKGGEAVAAALDAQAGLTPPGAAPPPRSP